MRVQVMRRVVPAPAPVSSPLNSDLGAARGRYTKKPLMSLAMAAVGLCQ